MTHQIATAGIHHIRLTVTDVARTRQFYTELLGFQLVVEISTGVILSNGQVMLGLRQQDPVKAQDRFDEDRVGLDHLSFSVNSRADLEQALRLFEKQGVSHSEITDLGPDFGIYILVFRDPDNFQLELSAPYS